MATILTTHSSGAVIAADDGADREVNLLHFMNLGTFLPFVCYETATVDAERTRDTRNDSIESFDSSGRN